MQTTAIARLRGDALASLAQVLPDELASAALGALLSDDNIVARLGAAAGDGQAIGLLLFSEPAHRVAWSHATVRQQDQAAGTVLSLLPAATALRALYTRRSAEVAHVARVIVGAGVDHHQHDRPAVELLAVLIEAGLCLSDADRQDWAAQVRSHHLDVAERARRADRLLRLGRQLAGGDEAAEQAAERVDDEIRRIIVDLRRISAPARVWQALQDLLFAGEGERWSALLRLARLYAAFRQDQIP